MGDFYADVCEDESILDTPFMFQYGDTLSICLAAIVGDITINDRYKWAIDDTWIKFCEYHGVDVYGDYDSYSDFLVIANA